MAKSGGLRLSNAIEDLAAENEPTARWALLTSTLRQFGLDQINYAFLDFESATRMEARGDPAMSTMSRDWIEHYTEQLYDMQDDAVAHVRRGEIAPMLWSVERAPRMSAPKVIYEAGDAGLRSGLLVPLAGPAGSTLSGAGIMLGSSFDEVEFLKLIGSQGMTLVALAHLFHAGAVGELMRRRHNTPPLTPRERDCLQLLARGLHTDAIGDRLAIATVTVEMHLRNARRKLGAKTSPEAIARALLYQQIQPT
ncbi:MAG: hypothetical protein GC204_03670 [Chloroflexi bacterium]|nr:hypothetical protein [Chloroflexota bacterium]